MIGNYCIKSWSEDKSHVAISFGEAELYKANYGVAQALGVQTMMQDLGSVMSVELQLDAIATIGVLQRHGFGKVRHIGVQDL